MVVNPAPCRRSMTPLQLEVASAKPPCTRTTVGAPVLGVDWFMASPCASWPPNTGDVMSPVVASAAPTPARRPRAVRRVTWRPSMPGTGSMARVVMRALSFLPSVGAGSRRREVGETVSSDCPGALPVRYLDADHHAGSGGCAARTELRDFAVKARYRTQAVLRDATMRSSDEAVADGEDGGGGARLEVEFGEQAGDVAADRARAERERLRDLAVAQALSKQAQD